MSHAGSSRGTGSSRDAGRTTPRHAPPRNRPATPQSRIKPVFMSTPVSARGSSSAQARGTRRPENRFTTPTTGSHSQVPSSAINHSAYSASRNISGLNRTVVPADDTTLVFRDDDFMDASVLEGYEPPEHVRVFEEMLKAREEFRKKSFEAANAKRQAERNQLLNPNLAKLAKESLETLNSALESFYTSETFKDLSKPEPEKLFTADAEPEGIPCPVEAHGELIDAFKAMGEINLILKNNPMHGVEAEIISDFIEESDAKLDKKLTSTEKLSAKVQSSIATGKKLNADLTWITETKDKFLAKKLPKQQQNQ